MLSPRLLATFLLCIGGPPAVAQTTPTEGRREPVVTVLGQGTYEAKPDQARFATTVETEGKTLDEAVKAHEVRATRAIEILQGLRLNGIEVEKSTFRIDERRLQKPLTPAEIGLGKKPQTIIEGYTAVTVFAVKEISLEHLNESVSKLAESGLFTVNSVRFQVVQERAALNQARRAAILDALEQARAYTDPVNLELGPIVAITDGDAEPPDGAADIPRQRLQGRYSVQILPPAVLQFEAKVNVTWRIAPR
jgi:uncharacterized protein YggE